MGSGLYEYLGIDQEEQDVAIARWNVREYANLIEALVSSRKALGMTQAQVAEIMGTTQSVISDFERIGGGPHMSTVQRYVGALGGRLLRASFDNPAVAEQGWNGDARQPSTCEIRNTR